MQSHALRDCGLASFTTWNVGGTAEWLLLPEREEDLVWIARKFCGERVPFEILAGGSNVLIADGLIRTPIVHTVSVKGMNVSVEGKEVYLECDAGVNLKDLFNLSMREGWSGLEFAVGIPGTLGGALMGNAGTSSGSISSIVASVKTVELDGTVRLRRAEDLVWGYRESAVSSGSARIISQVVLRLCVSDRATVLGKARRAAFGRAKQPRCAKTAGCVFKNTESQSAGELLDMAGCKGLSVGGAVVSPIHANFIENRGGCKASDIVKLILTCRRRVEEMFGVRLQLEIKTIGFPEDVFDG